MRRLLVTTLALACWLVPASSAAAIEPPPDERDYDDTVIVKYRPAVSTAEQRPLLERTGADGVIDEIDALGVDVVGVEADPAEVAERLDESPKVAYAEPNYLMRAQGRPNDALFARQWALRNVGQTGGRRGADIGAVEGWRRTGVSGYPSGGGVRVGLIDTGIDPSHPDLAGTVAACTERISPGLRTGSCLDRTGHGTHVAGTLAAAAGNGIGVAGIAFNSSVVVCRALGGERQVGRTSDIARCIGWTRRQGAKVISMSFAGDSSRTLRRAVRRAWDRGGRRGAVLVSAAGNGAERVATYPAAYPEVISVTATNDRDQSAWFSNKHRTVDLAAPGVSILSTRLGDGYGELSGTSMAVPHVAGSAAQLRSAHGGWTARRVRSVLRRSAKDLGPSGRDQRFGHGRVDLGRAAG